MEPRYRSEYTLKIVPQRLTVASLNVRGFGWGVSKQMDVDDQKHLSSADEC